VTEALKGKVLETGESRRQEVCIWWQGAPLYFDLLVVPLCNSAGAIAGVTCAAVDIPERKRTEVALRDSEHRFRQLAESLPQLVWTSYPDAEVDYLRGCEKTPTCSSVLDGKPVDLTQVPQRTDIAPCRTSPWSCLKRNRVVRAPGSRRCRHWAKALRGC
jgi:PAS domain-containing protein